MSRHTTTWWCEMCHDHWMHDRLAAGEPLEDPEFEAETGDDTPEE